MLLQFQVLVKQEGRMCICHDPIWVTFTLELLLKQIRTLKNESATQKTLEVNDLETLSFGYSIYSKSLVPKLHSTLLKDAVMNSLVLQDV